MQAMSFGISKHSGDIPNEGKFVNRRQELKLNNKCVILFIFTK